VKLGAYTACLHDKSLDEVLPLLAEMGFESLEVNAGGFIRAPHVHVDALMASAKARKEYLAQIADAGMTLTALNVNGNPLHPDPEVGPAHARDLQAAIELAGLLGVRNVVAMSGLPGAHPGATAPSWVVEPWNSAFTEVLDYQWEDHTVPFWRDVEARAARAGVRMCVEMHPHNVVYNPATLVRLIEQAGATHIGAEMDPSHLFWQGIEPVAAIEYLGDRVFHAAAKDVRINEGSRRLHGVLDDRFSPPGPGEQGVNIGGRYVLNKFPPDPPWQFVAVGRGHDVQYWASFLSALAGVDPGIAVNVEHEDTELGQLEGLKVAAETLRSARSLLAGKAL
jgi:sugar phosphate isomerase/epimerase